MAEIIIWIIIIAIAIALAPFIFQILGIIILIIVSFLALGWLLSSLEKKNVSKQETPGTKQESFTKTEKKK